MNTSSHSYDAGGFLVDAALVFASDGESAEGELGAELCSFSPDTPVLMDKGKTKPIGKIKPGDKVEAANPTTGKHQGPRTVQHVWINHDHDLLDLKVRTKEGHTSTLHTTANHPFWDETAHAWVAAGKLRSNDALNTDNNGHVYVVATKTTPGAANRWNLTVQQLHTYYVLAGETPVLVHNSDVGCADKLRNALNAAGDLEPATPHSPHHIVAGNSIKAAPARAQLDKFGIGINDAENGVWLPRSSSSPNPNGLSVHSRIHTNEYYSYVNELMSGARNRAEALDVIEHVRQQLIGGYWP